MLMLRSSGCGEDHEKLMGAGVGVWPNRATVGILHNAFAGPHRRGPAALKHSSLSVEKLGTLHTWNTASEAVCYLRQQFVSYINQRTSHSFISLLLSGQVARHVFDKDVRQRAVHFEATVPPPVPSFAPRIVPGELSWYKRDDFHQQHPGARCTGHNLPMVRPLAHAFLGGGASLSLAQGHVHLPLRRKQMHSPLHEFLYQLAIGLDLVFAVNMREVENDLVESALCIQWRLRFAKFCCVNIMPYLSSCSQDR
mmetsp:Transcript_45169/g.84295  ORF Transcript_45169/g.84295 Transcript_45169/m.84295 type:complete len:253 (-) Transcript_45169:349-1107(-)